MFDNEKEEWDINETLKVQFEPSFEASGDGYFNTPIKPLKIKKRENNNLTVGRIEQLTELVTIPKATYTGYTAHLETENKQLKEYIKELEAKVKHYEYILNDDDLK